MSARRAVLLNHCAGIGRSQFYSAAIVPRPCSWRSQKRALVSWTSTAEKHVTEALRNGILENDDDYFRTGVPQAQYTLPTETTLDSLLQAHSHIDAFETAKADISRVSDNLRDVIGSDNAVIRSIASHFFQTSGKMVRPTICCLMGRALQAGTLGSEKTGTDFEAVFSRQVQLAEISELIHTASLLHDDVIDEAATRRGVESVHSIYGNKFAILGGDFLLARASVSLARLRNCDVTEIMSTVIEHLVKGEVMQLKPSKVQSGHLDTQLQNYVTKSYYKTGSLIANSCKSVALLASNTDRETWDIAWEYGKNIGLAFQVVDDILDFEGCQNALGKPTLNDLKQGMATLPVLLATQTHPHLWELMERKFNQDGDVERAVEAVVDSGSIQRSREVAEQFGVAATASLMQLQPSVAQSALINLVGKVLRRTS